MKQENIEKQADLVTSLFSYRNGKKTFKDAFIDGANYAANEQENIDRKITYYLYNTMCDLSKVSDLDEHRKKFNIAWEDAKKKFEEIQRMSNNKLNQE